MINHYLYIFCWGGKPLEVRSCSFMSLMSGLEYCFSVSKLARINNISTTPQLLKEDL